MRHGRVTALRFLVRFVFDKVAEEEDRAQIMEFATQFLHDDNVPVAQQAAEACGELLLQADHDMAAQILGDVEAVMVEQPNDVKHSLLIVLKTFAKHNPELSSQFLDLTIPSLLQAARGRNLPVKLAAERALLHVTMVKSDASVLAGYVQEVGDEEVTKPLSDYCRRVLVKLEDSDDEEDEEGDGPVYS
eukprot:TRINITY_DN1364_c0_g1_i6.p2 TRINITY_DN1364_c0_g1~~TRINITY_DN1364_c0_g1_i6.p2  ORF type:complete len:189 (+),score=74.23 TRINITY_DN1364_c0_g1_i6:180-746(+)